MYVLVAVNGEFLSISKEERKEERLLSFNVLYARETEKGVS